MNKNSIRNLKINISKVKKYRLNKKIKKLYILTTPKIKDKGYFGKIKKNHKKEINERIEYFIKTMEENIPKKNLITMYNNLYSLKINERDLYLIIYNKLRSKKRKGIRGGVYKPDENKINIYSEKGLEYLKEEFNLKKDLTLDRIYTHELLHMSTTIEKDYNYYTGFHHDYKNLSIGRGLNEGYTELLNERIFNTTNASSLYAFYKEVTRILELIIGQDKMTELYFSSNLYGLYLIITKYISPLRTKKFIFELDNLKNNFDSIPNILEYLIILFNNKVINDYKENKITYKEATDEYQKLKEILKTISQIINKMTNNDKKINESILNTILKIKLENPSYTKIKRLNNY